MTAELRLGSNVVELRAKTRKPRILIAGEFSSGKTRLINGLLGGSVLPSNVTSTSLPPMWIVREPAAPFRLDSAGMVQPFDGIAATQVADTAFCLLSHDAPILDHMDLIDTPGNSDPNIPAEAWERMLGYADAVLWCSNAVQAWRQSEKSVWAGMPEHLLDSSTMLITHADHLTEDGAAERVMRRVKRDAAPFFRNFLMGSMVDQADVDAVARHLLSLCAGLRTLPGAVQADVDAARTGMARPVARVAPALAPTLAPAEPAVVAPAMADPAVPADRGIRPRRIRPDAIAAQPAVAAPAPFMLTEAVRVAPAAAGTAQPEAAPPAAGPAPVLPEIDLWPEIDMAPAPAAEAAPVAEAAVDPAFDSAAFQSLFAQLVTDSAPPADSEDGFAAEEDGARAELDDAGFDEDGIRFVPLVRPVAFTAGPARALWQRIARDYDLSDHQTLADCVELLIEEMDEILADAEIGGPLPPYPSMEPRLAEDLTPVPLRIGQAGGRRDH